MDVLGALAEHNAWANDRLLVACAAVPEATLSEKGDGYDSALGILRHLVQVEHQFLEIAQGRPASRIPVGDFAGLTEMCARLDTAYIKHARELTSAAAAQRVFVPWFDMEITLADAVIQPLTHSHKHRSDISAILPRLGGVGIEMDYISWLSERRRESQ